MLSRFHTIPVCHRQTDGIAISISRVSVLTRDKNDLKWHACKPPLTLVHGSIAMKTVIKSGRSTPFLYQYLATTAKLCDQHKLNTFQANQLTILLVSSSTGSQLTRLLINSLLISLPSLPINHSFNSTVGIHSLQSSSQQPRFIYSWWPYNSALI